MNFLAHIYLSGSNDKVMVGNFMADFVKGKAALAQYDAEIVRGIELHRTIDQFTDSHPVVSQSKDRLRPKYRHYSGVIVDVFYDHFLAKNWEMYHDGSLSEFAAQAYETIMKHQSVLPNQAQQMLPYMIRGNWLVNYSKTEGIMRALTGMARRTPYDSKMDEAVHELIRYGTEFEKEFQTFFSQLQDQVQKFSAGKSDII